MMWFDWIFGGRKAYQSLVASALITLAYMSIDVAMRGTYFWHFVLGILASFGIFTLGNIQEYKKNGNGGNGK